MKKTVLIFCTFCIFISIFSFYNCNAQVDTQTDTLQIKKHDPKKASWLAIVPGAGQIYNKKYWKLPIVYGGLGASGFLIYYYAKETNTYKNEYIARVNEDFDKTDPELANLSLDVILEKRDYNRRNMEITVAAFAIVYILSILDACVDAHLHYYDVSDNLSLGVKPKIDYHPITKTPTLNMAFIVKF